jgi:glycosyltransferase involved in cell wall biosynthesis
MKVLQVYKNYEPTLGGIEAHVRQLAVGLSARGVSSSVLVAASGPRTEVEARDGVQVIRAGRVGELASTPLSFELIRELGRADADIIHLHVPYPVGELGYLLAGRRRRLVVTYHSDVVRQSWANPVYAPILRRLLGEADAIIATSPTYVQSSPVLRPLADRCIVVPLGVDPARFGPHAAGAEMVRQSWCSAEFPKLVLFVGRFREYKGIPYLIDAVRGLPARLLLVGNGPTGSLIQARVTRQGQDRQVVILPGVGEADLPAYYAACDVFVLPSIQRSEAFGIAMVEAMASGRAVVSTELGTGTSWVNQDQVTGLVVPPADSAALRTALGTILSDDSARAKLGWEARIRVEAEFTEGAMLGHIEEIYRRILVRQRKL